jgi:tetratricopeptide (TPR) repeat protein
LQRARQAVKADAGDYRNPLLLGQIAAMVGKPDEAESAFRLAVKTSAAEAWASRLVFLAKTDAARAEAELANARRQVPAAQAPLVLALALEALGRLDQAEKEYRGALAAQPRNPEALRAAAGFFVRMGRSIDAEPPLRALLRPHAKAPPAMTAWARRTLALLLAGGGSYARLGDARTLLAENRKAHGEQPEDRWAEALVLAAHPAHRREAIGVLEDLLSRDHALEPEVRLALAGLYERLGRWPSARAQLLALVAAHPKHPVYLARLARGLLQHGEADAAAPWVDRLAAVAPGAVGTWTLRVQLLKARGKRAEAAELARAYARTEGARVDLAASWLEQLNEIPEAEKLFRAFAADPERPEGVLPLALHLARQGDSDAALDACAGAWTKCSPEAVAQVCLAVIRTDRETKAQVKAARVKRVEGWLTDALSKQPKDGRLRALLAELYETAGRYDEALAVHRELVRRAPGNAVARNNLAYLLALCARPAEALEEVDPAVAAVGPVADFLDTRGMAYLKGGKATLAVQDFEAAVAQVPAPVSYYHLALARRAAGDRPAALAAWREAQAGGLREADLHPLERPDLDRLRRELK